MKKFYLKSYNSAGTFLGNILNFQVGSFTKKINSGLEDLSFTLPRTIDNYNSDLLITLGNKLELWISDEDIAMVKIYTGYIEQHRFTIDGGRQTVEVMCLGIVSRMTMDILKNGNQTKIYTKTADGLTITGADISDTELAVILKALINYFRTNNATLGLNYSSDTGDSIQTSGKTMTYTFEAMTYAEAVKKITEAAPQNWYWYIDENEIMNFKGISNSADHNFLVGKHISKMTIERGIDSVKNIALVWDGNPTGIYKEYKDDASIGDLAHSGYGRRVQLISDSQIGVEATIDNFSAKFIAENKDARIRAVIEIIDNNENDKGYDIESIEPGDTCKITGIAADSGILIDNMIIKEVQWTPGMATITIETRDIFDLNRFMIDTGRKIDAQKLTDMPESYT